MSISIQRTAVFRPTGRSSADWVLSGLGLSAATVSASFAAYMVIVGPEASGVRTDGGFTVFAAFDRRATHSSSAGAPQSVPTPPRDAPPSLPAPVAAQGEVDFTPTGSIAPRPKVVESPASPGAAPQPSQPLVSFSIRDVFDGTALIETRNRLELVKPGSELRGAGTVLAIRRGENGWVVETSGGRIE